MSNGGLRDRRGVAVLLALLILSLLTVLILEMDVETRLDLQAAVNFRDGAAAEELARAGVSAARAILREDAVRRGTTQAYRTCTELGSVNMLLAQYPVGDGLVSLMIECECGKLYVNGLVTRKLGEWEPDEQRVEQMKRLFQLLELDPDVVDAVVDWIDPDEEAMPYGAEQSDYDFLPRPYLVKNDFMEDLSELRLVKGITEEAYQTLRAHLTVAKCKLDINSATPEVLMALEGRIDTGTVERIMTNRPFKTIKEFSDIVGKQTDAEVAQRVRGLVGVTSPYFTATARGCVPFAACQDGRGSVKIATALIERTQRVTTIRSWKTG